MCVYLDGARGSTVLQAGAENAVLHRNTQHKHHMDFHTGLHPPQSAWRHAAPRAVPHAAARFRWLLRPHTTPSPVVAWNTNTVKPHDTSTTATKRNVTCKRSASISLANATCGDTHSAAPPDLAWRHCSEARAATAAADGTSPEASKTSNTSRAVSRDNSASLFLFGECEWAHVSCCSAVARGRTRHSCPTGASPLKPPLL